MTKIKFASFVLVLSLFSSLFSQDFDIPIKVTDGTNNQILTIGVDPNGTDGYDSGLDIFAPPPPPTGAFDARLEWQGEQYITDIRDNSTEDKTYVMKYQPATGGEIILSWDNMALNDLGTFVIVDNITGLLFNLDMTTTNSLAISSSQYINNGLRIQVNIKLPPTPADLQVTEVKAPTQAYSGQPIEVSWVITNTGGTGTNVPEWYDQVYFSQDSVFNPETVKWSKRFQNIAYLAPNDGYSNKAIFDLPKGIVGDYYVFVRTDINNQVPESDDDNNMGRNISAIHVDLPPLPDLQVTSIIAPNNAFSGQDINIFWTVQNHGTASTDVDEWHDAIFLTQDSVLNIANATQLLSLPHKGILEANNSYSRATTVTLPHKIFGSYYLFVITDIIDNVYEHAWENNNTLRSDPLIITLSPPPDLVVTNIINPDKASVNETITIEWNVKNQGPGAPFETGWYDCVYLSQDSTYNPDSVIKLKSFYRQGPLEPDSLYTIQAEIKIPSKIFGKYYIFVKTDYNNQVFEHTYEDNNVSVGATPIEILYPDLIITNLVIPTTGANRQTVSVEWNVKNQGLGALVDSYWSDQIFLSETPTFDPTSLISLGSFSRATLLLPDSSYTVKKDVVIPNGLSGSYFIFVKTDYNNQVFEHTSEDNNLFLSTNPIEISYPDLIITKLVIPSSGAAGQTISIEWTVKNQGLGTLFNARWSDRIFLSAFPTFDPNSSILLDSYSQSTVLVPNSSYTVKEDVVIPKGTSGTYYIFVKTDWYDQIFEYQYEDNNLLRSDGTIQIDLSPWPDLQVTSVNVPSGVTAGDQFLLKWEVQNKGSAPVSVPSWIDRIYLSKNPVWDESATFLKSVAHSGALGISASYSETELIKLASNLEGEYYIHIETDGSNSVYEYNDEDNNYGYSDALVVQPYPPVDLNIKSLTAPDSAWSGQQFSIGWVVENIGSGKTLRSSWQDAAYLSLDKQLNPNEDILLTSVTHRGALDSNQAYSRNETVTLSDDLSGNYYLIVKTDAYGQTKDINHNNNIILSSTSIILTQSSPPDLQVSSLFAPSHTNAGQPITINWTVHNNGTGPTPKNTWFDAVYLSQNATLDKSDDRLGRSVHHGSLQSSGSYSSSLEVNIPNYLSGNFYLILLTDSRDDVFELNNETNNTKATPINIILPPPSDLIVTEIVLPDSAVPGEEVTISWTIQNIGGNPAVGWLQDAAYISADEIWEVEDPMVGIDSRFINLAPGAKMKVNIQANLAEMKRVDSEGNIIETLPGATPGAYYVIVRTDIRNNIREGTDTGAEPLF